MKRKTTYRSAKRTPAFLSDFHRGLDKPPSNLRPAPELPTTQNKALGLLPRLTAEIGFAMAGRKDVTIEILPGTPTTLVFSSAGKLMSLLVLPLSEEDARKLTGIPGISTTDLVADQLWEEQRDVPTPEMLLTELPASEL